MLLGRKRLLTHCQIFIEDKQANYAEKDALDMDNVALRDRQTVLLEAQRALVTIRDRFKLSCVAFFLPDAI